MLTSFFTLAQAKGAILFLDSSRDYIALFPVHQPQIVFCGSITSPSSDIAPAPVAVELARIANDELAQVMQKYPDRFAGGIATLPGQTD
jgi:predicted TIM-barrel fold metal-dependent hydrolase